MFKRIDLTYDTTPSHHTSFLYWKGKVKKQDFEEKKDLVGEPSDPREGPVRQQRERAHVCACYSGNTSSVGCAVIASCIMCSLLEFSLIIPAT